MPRSILHIHPSTSATHEHACHKFCLLWARDSGCSAAEPKLQCTCQYYNNDNILIQYTKAIYIYTGEAAQHLSVIFIHLHVACICLDCMAKIWSLALHDCWFYRAKLTSIIQHCFSFPNWCWVIQVPLCVLSIVLHSADSGNLCKSAYIIIYSILLLSTSSLPCKCCTNHCSCHTPHELPRYHTRL
jgi:hypothetical protein